MNFSSLAANDFLTIIREGIRSANGLDEDLDHLSKNEFIEIGKKIGAGGNFRRSLFSCNITPIDKFTNAIQRKSFQSCHQSIVLDQNAIPLETIQIKSKKVYFVPANKPMMNVCDILEIMNWAGLIPCINAPNYLLGLLTQFTEENAPKAIRRNLVAVEPNNSSSIFSNPSLEEENSCFLAVRNDSAANFGISSKKLCNYIDFVLTTSNFNSNEVSEWSFLAQDCTCL